MLSQYYDYKALKKKNYDYQSNEESVMQQVITHITTAITIVLLIITNYA